MVLGIPGSLAALMVLGHAISCLLDICPIKISGPATPPEGMGSQSGGLRLISTKPETPGPLAS